MRSLLFASLLVSLGACGGNDAAPSLITGGGVGSGDIDGRVNVYVIDESTNAPIANAKVRVGTIDGMTDSTGLFIANGSLSGNQNVTAVATGHVPTMWVGVDGANVTIPVTATGASSTNVPQAELDGTITGWASLDPAKPADALIAGVAYSQTHELGAPENGLAQPPGPVQQIPGNACLKSQIASPACAWKTNVRTGRVALLATILNRDFNGTADASDDITTVVGYAQKTAITVVNGQNQTGDDLTQLAAGDTATGGVDFGTPPGALDKVQAIVGLDLGEDGIAYIANPLTPAAHTMLIPKTSAFSGSTYRVLGQAQKSTSTDTQSLISKKGLTDASNVAVGAWMDTPTGITATGDTLTLAAVSGANITGFEIRGPGATDAAWSVTMFDGSLSATLPTDLAPIPTGTDTLRAQAIDADFDPHDFNLQNKLDLVNRLSSDTVSFTR
jgi:hypothetical protein